MNLISTLILLFYVSAATSFLISVAAFTLESKIRANLWTLGMIAGIFVTSWIGFAIS